MRRNSETIIEMAYGENLSVKNNGCLVAKLRIGEGQTTMAEMPVKPQAIGGRNGLLLTLYFCEDEEIVSSLMKIRAALKRGGLSVASLVEGK